MWWDRDALLGGGLVEYVLRVDGKGRVVIPSEVRKALNIGKVVRLRVREKFIIIEPIENPLEELSKLVEEVGIKASAEPWGLSEAASNQLMKECGKS